MFNSTTKDVFKLITSNRDVDKKHVDSIKNSILTFGVLRPIICDTNFRILDGQHLYYALKALNLPFYYITVDVKKTDSINLMSILNNTSKPWRLTYYLHLWMAINPVYKSFKVKLQQYNLSIVTGIKVYSNNSSSELFKKGKLEFHNENNSDLIASRICELKATLPNFRRVSDALYLLLSQKDYDHNVMVSKLKGRKLNFPEDKIGVIYSVLLNIYKS